jgi:hypothetical protein
VSTDNAGQVANDVDDVTEFVAAKKTKLLADFEQERSSRDILKDEICKCQSLLTAATSSQGVRLPWNIVIIKQHLAWTERLAHAAYGVDLVNSSC